MSDTIYNIIGNGYNTTRKADPYIADQLYQLLSPTPEGRYLDIGCGTGNYLQAMLARGIKMIGVDPSETMLAAAKSRHLNTDLICADSENIPFPNSYFDGAIAVLTIHHWHNIESGLKELHRVIKQDGKLIFFSYTPEQVRAYWLAHYFPKMIDKAANMIPTSDVMTSMLANAGFSTQLNIPYFVREDLQDHFMYSHKSKPEQYLVQQVRDGASAFRLAEDKQEIEGGLITLRNDIASGYINEIMGKYENDLGDYLFISCTA